MVNKFGDKVKKVQCHAINKLITLVRQQAEKTDVMALVMREIQLFMERPGIKPSHRIYALGFLNKVVGQFAQSQDVAVRASALTIYFNLFNKLLGQDEATNADKIKQIKQNRKISKKQKQKLIAKVERAGDVDEEDNKVIELVLKGVNTIMQKSSSRMDDDLKKVLDKQIDILFRLTHHKVFRIQLQTLKLLFQFAKTSNRLVNTQDAGDPEAPASTFADRFYRTLYEFILKTHGQKSMDDYFGLLFRAIKAD